MYDRTCERQRKRRTTLASSNQQHRVRMMVPRWSCVGTLLLLLLALQKPECCRRDGTSSQHSSTFFFACALETATDYEDDVDARQQAANSTSLRRGGGGDGLGEEGHKPIRPESSKERLTMNEILLRAGKRGLGGGIPGALAGVMQVVSLMWLRTIVNYQSRYGTTFSQALTTLMKEGGIRRLYRGIGFALIQAPLARFVSTAANDGIQSLLSHLRFTADWGPGRTTAVASLVVGLWRIFLMPIDTMKTVLQVDSTEGFRSLIRRVRAGKISVLYQGAVANAISSILGHYPWFFTYNWLAASDWVLGIFPSKLLRHAFIGLNASIASDIVVNSIRVIKTTKQSLGSKHTVSYSEVIRIVLAADGWRGLFGRGLSTRILGNALQSMIFTVIWQGLAERWRRKGQKDEEPR